MAGTGRQGEPPLIERTPLRALFAQLVGRAIGETDAQPSPMATAYLVELLEEQARVGEGDEPETLAEAWLAAGRRGGAERIRALRGLGDRALFVSGFFSESLVRGVVSGSYYRDMGRRAYGAVARSLPRASRDEAWPRLFEELADRFPELAMVLGEVSEQARASGSPERRSEWLLGLYERYLATGSARDRRRLVRAGCVPPETGGRDRWQ